MDKGLLIKVLGKADGVKLEDLIYNLRDVTDTIRYDLVGNVDMFDESFINNLIKELEEINNWVKEIRVNLENTSSMGYTNSRNYLEKYLSGISDNIIELTTNLIPFNEKDVIFHNNILCDYVLKY